MTTAEHEIVLTITDRDATRIAQKVATIRALENNGRRDAATEEMASLFFLMENMASYYDWTLLR